jgi:hypothetical protein
MRTYFFLIYKNYCFRLLAKLHKFYRSLSRMDGIAALQQVCRG